MDGTSIGYDSEVFRKYSPTADSVRQQHGRRNTRPVFRKSRTPVSTLIGQTDHLQRFVLLSAIIRNMRFQTQRGETPCTVADASYWPSAFCRYVWEYKVELAKEAVALFGFNEIQFDYVRFPDRHSMITRKTGNIDYRNEYDETKAQAIQRFLMYACDGCFARLRRVCQCRRLRRDLRQLRDRLRAVLARHQQRGRRHLSGMPYPDHFAQQRHLPPVGAPV